MAICKFGKSDVVIPLIVVEELDRFKKDQNENGRNARHFSRIVDELREKGSVAKGVKLENGGTFRIFVDRKDGKYSNHIDLSLNDNFTFKLL